MQDALHEADELVLEYILFRGFTETYRTFGAEQKQDKTRCFNVDRLLEQLQTCCATHDAAGLLDLWGFLKTTFFSHLDEIEAATVSQTENDLKRNFIVAAIMDGQSEKAVSFLQMQADSLARDPRWREWFSLPFLSNPSADPHFSVYFQREWRDLFNASLRNFLASTLRKTPMPKLLAFELSRMRQSADRCALASKTAEALQLNERVSELELAVEHQRRQNCELLAHLRSHLVGLTSADAIAALAAATADAALPGDTASTLEPRFRAALRGEAAVAAASASTSAGSSSAAAPPPVAVPAVLPVAVEQRVAAAAATAGESGGGGGDGESLLVEMGTPSAAARGRASSRSSPGLADSSDAGAGFTTRATSVLRSHRASITRCAFSADGSFLASADAGATLCVWAVREPQQPQQQRWRARSTSSGSASSSGSSAAAAAAATSTPTPHATIFCSAEVLSMVWTGRRLTSRSVSSPSGSHDAVQQVLMYGTADNTITMWAVDTKATIASMRTHSSFPRVIEIACHPSAQRFVTSLRSVSGGGPGAFAFASGASAVDESSVSGSPRAKLQCWSMQHRACTGELPLGANSSAVTSVAYNHNGALLIAGSQDGVARVFDMRSKTAIMVRHRCCIHTNTLTDRYILTYILTSPFLLSSLVLAPPFLAATPRRAGAHTTQREAACSASRFDPMISAC